MTNITENKKGSYSPIALAILSGVITGTATIAILAGSTIISWDNLGRNGGLPSR